MLWTAFILGLAGSLHCAGMCGPLALALSAAGPGGVRQSTGCLVYNLGRVTTYSLLGVVAGVVGQSLALVGLQRWVSIGAGGLILAGILVSSGARLGSPMIRVLQGLKAVLGTVLRRRTVFSLGLLGLLNGLLPCGLVYVAWAGAAATGGVVSGVEYMALFGLGTVPVMLGLGLSGRSLPAAWLFQLRRMVPFTLALVGLLLILRGLALGIPYVSPDLAAGVCGHCH